MSETNLEEDVHSRLKGVTYSFLGFLVATFIGVLAKGSEIKSASIILILLSISIPSLIALVFLDFHLRIRQKIDVSAIRGLAVGLGFIPGLFSIALLASNISLVAAVILVLLSMFWVVIVFVVSIAPALREECCKSEHNDSIEKGSNFPPK